MKYDNNYLKKSRKVGKTMHKSAGIEQYSYPVGPLKNAGKRKHPDSPDHYSRKPVYLLITFYIFPKIYIR